MSRVCKGCSRDISDADYRRVYCDNACRRRAKYSRESQRLNKVLCAFCNQSEPSHGKKYCSNKCVASARKQSVIEKYLNDPNTGTVKAGLSQAISRYLKEQAGWKCQSPNCCVPGGWSEIHPVTGVVPVEIDHIDGDAYNNHPDNLIVLCPNCHSLTANYRALNKKSGRAYRSEFNQYEKKKNTGSLNAE